MFCYLDSCDNNITMFKEEADGDCILHHVIALKRELSRIVNHYAGKFLAIEYSINNLKNLFSIGKYFDFVCLLQQ